MILLATILILTAACVSRADHDSRTADVGASTAAFPPGHGHAVREHCPAPCSVNKLRPVSRNGSAVNRGPRESVGGRAVSREVGNEAVASVASLTKPPAHCPGSIKAITYYRRAYTASRTAMGLAGAVPRVWYQHCPALRARAVAWRGKAKTARLELAVWERDNYQWWRWMPRGSKWYRVASCETGYGRDPNWAHDSGTYVSAFGIYRPGYADDAHRIGNMSWDETVRARGTVPTPREQYDAALSHYRAHGGFSGWGCRGA